MSEYKYCYLNTGVWIIGKLEDQDTVCVKLSDVRVVQPTFNQDKQQLVLQFIPFEMSNQDSEVVVYKESISATVKKVPEHLLKGYIENTSRIQMVG